MEYLSFSDIAGGGKNKSNHFKKVIISTKVEHPHALRPRFFSNFMSPNVYNATRSVTGSSNHHHFSGGQFGKSLKNAIIPMDPAILLGI